MMTNSETVRIGSRTSPLALKQAEEVVLECRAHYPDIRFEVIGISTRGDRHVEEPLLSLGRGMFSTDIEDALLDGEVDLAVHSAKDLRPTLPDGLVLAGTIKRSDPRDVNLNKLGLPIAELPAGTCIGTSSPRRTALLKSMREDLNVVHIRGNIGSRIGKIGTDGFDGIILAAAGLVRLGLETEICEYLDIDKFTPDVGQGTIALEVRSVDDKLLEMLQRIDHIPTTKALLSERAFLNHIGGGCDVPVAGYAKMDGQSIELSVMAALPDGSCIVRSSYKNTSEDPVAVGVGAAETLSRECGNGPVKLEI